jgi:hypothetical protein
MVEWVLTVDYTVIKFLPSYCFCRQLLITLDSSKAHRSNLSGTWVITSLWIFNCQVESGICGATSHWALVEGSLARVVIRARLVVEHLLDLAFRPIWCLPILLKVIVLKEGCTSFLRTPRILVSRGEDLVDTDSAALTFHVALQTSSQANLQTAHKAS